MIQNGCYQKIFETLNFLGGFKYYTLESFKARSGGLVFKTEDSCRRGPGSNPDTAKETIFHVPFIWIKAWIKNMLKTWHCCICCNPANGKVDIVELLAYKIQLHGLEGILACQLKKIL